MGRAPCCDKANVKKGPWSPEEDAKLKNFIDTNGTGGNWITLPSKAGLKRCGKSCRLRWINYLRPDIKHGSFTEDEERTIYQLHASMGSRWSIIAGRLPGRTDNDIKNYWNTRLKKKLADRVTSAQCQQQQHCYHMHNLQNMAAELPSLSVEAGDGWLGGELGDPWLPQIILQPPVQQYYQQNQPQQYNATPLVDQQLPLPTFSEQQHQQMLAEKEVENEMLDVKNEVVNSQTIPVKDERRLIAIESGFLDCITPTVDSNGMPSSTSSVQVHPAPAPGPMSPVPVDISCHRSPASSGSGVTSDRSYGGQFAESAYSDRFSGYQDPTRLAESQSSTLLDVANVLPPQLQPLQNGRKEHAPSATQRFALAEPYLEPFQASLLSETPMDRQAVKEESVPDWDLALSGWSPAAAATLMTRCGAENTFAVQYQALTPSPQMLDASFVDHQYKMKQNHMAY